MYRVAGIEVSDVYEFEFGVIALSRNVSVLASIRSSPNS